MGAGKAIANSFDLLEPITPSLQYSGTLNGAKLQLLSSEGLVRNQKSEG